MNPHVLAKGEQVNGEQTGVIQLRRPKDESSRIPYRQLNQAARDVAARNPEASLVRPMWAPASSGGEILVEVTTHGRTKVVAP